MGPNRICIWNLIENPSILSAGLGFIYNRCWAHSRSVFRCRLLDEGFPNGIFHSCALWARALARWESCWRAVAVAVGVSWQFGKLEIAYNLIFPKIRDPGCRGSIRLLKTVCLNRFSDFIIIKMAQNRIFIWNWSKIPQFYRLGRVLYVFCSHSKSHQVVSLGRDGECQPLDAFADILICL